MVAFVMTIIENLPDWGPRLLAAAAVTGMLTAGGFLLALLLGLIIEFARTRSLQLPRLIARLYVGIMRGVPLLVVLYLLYFALPDAGITLSSLVAGVLGLGLVYGAYLGEVFRAGFASLAPGQRESALAAGLTPWQTFRLILLPQVIRRLLPPLLVTLISLLKDSSICALIAVPELTLASRAIMSESFLPLHVFATAAAVYFCIAWPASVLVRYLERRLETPRRPTVSRSEHSLTDAVTGNLATR